jgi:hypothetical protein
MQMLANEQIKNVSGGLYAQCTHTTTTTTNKDGSTTKTTTTSCSVGTGSAPSK